MRQPLRRLPFPATPAASLWLRYLAAAVLAGLWASAAQAAVLLFSSNPGEQSFASTGFVDLNGSSAGGTSLTFTTAQPNQRVIITFDATCFIQGGVGWGVITILVDPAGPAAEFSAPPTNGIANNGVLFCYFDGSNLKPNGIRGSVTASVRPAQAGTHTLKVRVRPATQSGPPIQVTIQTPSIAVIN
jgi:hypothetical protein